MRHSIKKKEEKQKEKQHYFKNLFVLLHSSGSVKISSVTQRPGGGTGGVLSAVRALSEPVGTFRGGLGFPESEICHLRRNNNLTVIHVRVTGH